jgi:hypothetical protein
MRLGAVKAAQGQLEAALPLLNDALAIRITIEDGASAAYTRAHLALVHLQRNEMPAALDYAAAVQQWVEQNGAAGLEAPVEVYWLIYQVLRAAAATDATYQAAAAVWLADGYALLNDRANKLEDATRRHRFLTHVPHNRALLSAYEARTADR